MEGIWTEGMNWKPCKSMLHRLGIVRLQFWNYVIKSLQSGTNYVIKTPQSDTDNVAQTAAFASGVTCPRLLRAPLSALLGVTLETAKLDSRMDAGLSSKIWPMYLGLLEGDRLYISVECTIVMERGVGPIYKGMRRGVKGLPVNDEFSCNLQPIILKGHAPAGLVILARLSRKGPPGDHEVQGHILDALLGQLEAISRKGNGKGHIGKG
ncbi:hypothetical protein BS47DRAFT_1408242 [Hydnum rufescens UP504]|uniref:Uncharacterized protein n=1 Tax=Hydnum rufescens UP504 TaxID=1448309 RepID=A0A9P6AS54_9AGAM|nr:hypothetical protein BS47DRAFT_1408242 [Hydnum rufescens UP504]